MMGLLEGRAYLEVIWCSPNVDSMLLQLKRWPNFIFFGIIKRFPGVDSLPQNSRSGVEKLTPRIDSKNQRRWKIDLYTGTIPAPDTGPDSRPWSGPPLEFRERESTPVENRPR